MSPIASGVGIAVGLGSPPSSGGGGPDYVTDNLIANWDWGDSDSYPGTGTTVTDIADDYDGTLVNGPAYQSSDGGWMDFDGVNDYMDLGTIATSDALAMVGDNTFTVDMWIKPDLSGDAFQRIIEKSTGGGGAGGWGIWINGETFYLSMNATSNGFLASSYLTAGEWHHVVMIMSSSRIRWFINNVLRYDVSHSISGASNVNANMSIGNWNHTVGERHYNGGIAAIKVYSDELTFTAAVSGDAAGGEVTQNWDALKDRFGL